MGLGPPQPAMARQRKRAAAAAALGVSRSRNIMSKPLGQREHAHAAGVVARYLSAGWRRLPHPIGAFPDAEFGRSGIVELSGAAAALPGGHDAAVCVATSCW